MASKQAPATSRSAFRRSPVLQLLPQNLLADSIRRRRRNNFFSLNLRFHPNRRNVFRQFYLCARNVRVQQATDVGQSFRHKAADSSNVSGDGIRLRCEKALRDFGEFTFAAIDGLGQRGRMSASYDSFDQPPQLLLDLLAALAHPRDLARNFGKGCRQLPLKFSDGVFDNFGLQHGPLKFEKETLFQPIGSFLESVRTGLAIKVLRTPILPMVAFSPPGDDNEVHTARAALQKSSQ